ncbi:MAG: NAD-binding protein [Alphaproteobacteria bacterium]|nr:NAD-binding protein [Alphaproteobacteria bacterium]
MKVIIAGLGDSGNYIARYLLEENFDITIIDIDTQKIKLMSDNEEVAGIIGDITSIDTLNTADIKSADIFIAATDKDEVNILAIQLAKYFGVKYNLCVLKDSKFQSEAYKEVFHNKIIPVDDIISIDNSMIKSILEQIKYSYIKISNVLTFFSEKIKMFSVLCDEDSTAVNKTISSIYESIKDVPFRIVGIQNNNNFNMAVDGDIIREGDRVFVIVEEQYINNVYSLFFDIDQSSNKFLESQSPNIIIDGDHPFIKTLAVNLAQVYSRIKVVSKSKNNAENMLIAMDLEKYGIQLIEDDIMSDDYRNNYLKTKDDIIVLINKDDNDTLLQSLFLKYQGFSNLFCYLNTDSSESFLLSHQVNHIITPNYFRMSPILSYIRRGVIMNAYTLAKKVETMEIIVSENSKIAGRKVSEIEVDGKFMVSMIIDEQGNVVKIESSTIIKPQYQLIIVVLRKYIATMEEDFLQNIDNN